MNYFLLFVIASLSLISTIYFDISETLKVLTATPLVASLTAMLVHLFRDDKKFLNDLIKQDREHQFTLAATSHMSEVVFDKHVEFAEKYVEEMNTILDQLFGGGVTVKDLRLSYSLSKLRIENRLWLSYEMTRELEVFEKKIIEFTSSSSFADLSTQREGNDAERKAYIEKAFDLLRNILEINEEEEGQGNSLVIKHLQDILGITHLTKMRDTVLKDSAS